MTRIRRRRAWASRKGSRGVVEGVFGGSARRVDKSPWHANHTQVGHLGVTNLAQMGLWFLDVLTFFFSDLEWWDLVHRSLQMDMMKPILDSDYGDYGCGLTHIQIQFDLANSCDPPGTGNRSASKRP